MKKNIILSLLLIISAATFAQVEIDIFKPIPSSYDGDSNVKVYSTKKVNVDKLPLEFKTLFNGKTHNLSTTLPLSDDFSVTLASGRVAVYETPKFYGSPTGSLTFTTSGKKQIYGLLDNQSIEPSSNKKNSRGVISGAIDAFSGSPYCEQIILEENDPPNSYSDIIPDLSKASEVCVKLYIEVDSDIFFAKGSVQEVVNYVTALFNEVNTIYKNDGINVVLHKIHIWDKESPYVNGASSSLLNQFGAIRTEFDGDLAQLLSFKSSGGIAYVGALCYPNTKVRMSFCNIKNQFNRFPKYSWSVMVMAHELGHNLGSQHTHSCAWNGNNTAIDNCRTTEGGCQSTDGIPSNGGTIMSYCHLQSVGINFNLGFGTQPKERIQASILKSRCLTGDCETGGGGPVECTNELIITFDPDLFGSENSYIVTNESGIQVFKKDGFPDKSGDNVVYIDTICIQDGCYTVELIDEFEDGICCLYGEGSLKISVGGELIKTFSSGNTLITSFDFCTGGVVSCNHPVFNDNTEINSYGTNQDHGTGSVLFDGVLRMGTNTWKSITLDEPIAFSSQDSLSFEVQIFGEGEIHGIGFDFDDRISRDLTFEFHGNQNWGLKDESWAYGSTLGVWKTITIPVGDYYASNKSGVIFDRIFFANDNDRFANDPQKSLMNIRNVVIKKCR